MIPKSDRHRCRICFRDIHHHQDFYHWLKPDHLICGACRNEWNRLDRIVTWQDLSIHILYEYNDVLENLLFQYKEGGDVALRDVFFFDTKRMIERRYHDYTIVLMPSSDEKNEERGFYALKEMVSQVSLPQETPFYKSENRKQSTLSYAERQNIADVIRLRDTKQYKNRKLLLVDDVCTSGATLHCAYRLLKPYTNHIRALVLCAHPLFLDQHDSPSFMTSIISTVQSNISKRKRSISTEHIADQK